MSILKDHDCIKKNCFYLEKYTDRQFWIQRANLKKKKIENKKLAKERKIATSMIDDYLKRLLDDAQKIADNLNYDIIITRVAHKTTPEHNDYIINYVSNNRHNDWHDYFDIIFHLRNYYGGRYTLRHLKRPDGIYATIDDWNRKK